MYMYCRRMLESSLYGPVSRGKVRLLFGARQTGKTSLLRAGLPDETTYRVDLAGPAKRRAYEADPSLLARELAALPARTTNVVIDEVQKVPALLDEVQSLYDADKRRFELFLTGSSARRLKQNAASLLPGRAHLYRLTPVSQWEVDGFAPLAGLDGAPPSAQPAFPRQSLTSMLLYGSLPGVREEAPESAAATLAAYVETYLEEEIRREAMARDLGAFANFLRLAAVASGQTVNVAALSQDSGVPASSVKNHYQVLVDTFVGYWVMPYLRDERQRVLKTPRFYFFDVGVRNAAAALPLHPGLLNSEGPHLLEHWVGLELLYRAEYLGRGYRLSFWRLHSGAEVDFVWETPAEDVPIEVKWTERPTVSDARHLELFLARHSKRARRGLVICRAPRPQQLTPRVLAVPYDAF
jgi:uncharacterized protein